MVRVPRRQSSVTNLYANLNRGQVVLHVEDKGKKSLYQEIITKIFGNDSRNYFIQDIHDGKLGVIACALKEKHIKSSNVLYLLDKDYDDLFPNDRIFYEKTLDLLKGESEEFKDEVRIQTFEMMSNMGGVKFLKKYSIENYLLDSLEGLIHGIFLRKGTSKEIIIKDPSFRKAFTKTKEILITTTSYKALNKKKRLTLSLNVTGIIDINAFTIKSDILNHQLGNFKTECPSCSETFDSLLEDVKSDLRIDDIPGKDILTIFLSWLKNKSDYKLEVGQEEACRLLASSLNGSQCENLKEFFTI